MDPFYASSKLNLISVFCHLDTETGLPGDTQEKEYAVDLAAAAAGGGTILNNTGIDAFLGSIFAIVILTLGIRAGMHAHRSNYAAVIGMVGILALAAMVWNIASGGQVTTLGHDLVGQFLHI
jgi:hypothetical protein